jgi:hypothetical protein
MRSCPQRGVLLRLAPVHAPAAPAARPRSRWSRALNHVSIQARAQHQHRLANRSSAQADADVAALRVTPATPRAVSAASASRQAAHAPASPADHQPPPDRRSAAVQALRRAKAVAVSPACQQQSGPSASCAHAARAPDINSPRGERPRRLKRASRRITRRHLTHHSHNSCRRRTPPLPVHHCAQARCGPCACACAAAPCPTRQGRRWRVRRSLSALARAACVAKRCEHTMRVPPSRIRTHTRCSHPLPPDTRHAAVQALRRADAHAVSPACPPPGHAQRSQPSCTRTHASR